jgi:hypothetical protein
LSIVVLWRIVVAIVVIIPFGCGFIRIGRSAVVAGVRVWSLFYFIFWGAWGSYPAFFIFLFWESGARNTSRYLIIFLGPVYKK